MGADLIGHNGSTAGPVLQWARYLLQDVLFWGPHFDYCFILNIWPEPKKTLPLILISLLLILLVRRRYDASVAHLFYFSGSLQNTVQNVKCRWILMTWSRKSKTLSSIRSASGLFFSCCHHSCVNLHVPNSCSLCARPFSSGDEFLLTDLRLFCRQCHEQELDHHGNGVRNGVRLWERKRVATRESS